MIIVCEGEKIEPIYFKHFKSRNKLISIKIVKSAAGKDYDALIRKAVEEKANIESSCTVWCVSDVDVDHNTPDNQFVRNTQLKKYYEDAKRNGFEIALSNPCFEVWFLLHFICSTGQMKNYYEVRKKLVEYLLDYHKNSNVYGQL